MDLNGYKVNTSFIKSSRIKPGDIEKYCLNPKTARFGRAWFLWFPRVFTNKGIPFKSHCFQLSFQWLYFDYTLWVRANQIVVEKGK